MNLLLDTHALLWALADEPTLANGARDAITDGRNRVLVSTVSVWEIVIKKALGKLHAPDDLPQQLTSARLEPLEITITHALAVGDLPDHHTDPFDRMLVAQARTEGLTLVTRDARIAQYDVAVLPA
ncbi:MAG: type II toxin-antitoxin system VapC family toxin [Egibacteraceae bacterium]